MNIKKIDYSSPLYKYALDVLNAVWPNYIYSENELLHFDKNYDPKLYFQRFIVFVKNIVVGTGLICEPWWSLKPGKYYFELNILQKNRKQGIGTNCFNYIENTLSKRNGTKLDVHTKEDLPASVQFLENRGFSIALREPESKLYIQDFDFNAFIRAEEDVKNNGFVIKSLSELQKIDPNWKEKLYNLYSHIMNDIPSNDPNTERTIENFENQKLKAPNFDANANFIAMENNEYVGLSSLWRQESNKSKLWTDLTGVLRTHRRKGIALALKIQTIRFAKLDGVLTIETDNEENNPMFGINKYLGFVPQPAWLTYEKRY